MKVEYGFIAAMWLPVIMPTVSGSQGVCTDTTSLRRKTSSRLTISTPNAAPCSGVT